MALKIFNFFAVATILFCACNSTPQKKQENMTEKYEKGTFGYDLNFLQSKDSVIILKNAEGNGQVIVSAKYQGKVFTSTTDGNAGKSFAWINYKQFDAAIDPHMNAYGGEDRLWLGPEGGKFSLFFKPGTKMEFENWKTPAPIDTESWEIVSSNEKKVSIKKEMEIMNYAGTNLKLRVERDIEILENENIKELLGVEVSSEVKSVGFKTTNNLINTGKKEWNKETGAPCMWNLDMLSPSEKTTIIIPYKGTDTGKVATTDYFGEIPKDRIHCSNGILLFKGDGKSRGKLGITPLRATNIAGSYNSDDGILTIVQFNVDSSATYLNQEWKTDKDPFIGDAVNSYNDGPLADGKQMGPFYELESVSPAAFLKPGERLTHRHSVFHFTGNKLQLNIIAKKLFNISLNEIESAFN